MFGLDNDQIGQKPLCSPCERVEAAAIAAVEASDWLQAPPPFYNMSKDKAPQPAAEINAPSSTKTRLETWINAHTCYVNHKYLAMLRMTQDQLYEIPICMWRNF